jgi:predicted RNA-binding protein with PIN domain
MTNKILIDGWNVCHKIPQIAALIPDDLAAARRMLQVKVQSYASGRKVKFRIIYDGQGGIYGGDEGSATVEVRFSRNPESADYKIVRQLRDERNPRQWTVVTSDRDLAARCKSLGSNVVSSAFLITRLNNSQSSLAENREKSDPRLTDSEMNYWLKMFNKDDE